MRRLMLAAGLIGMFAPKAFADTVTLYIYSDPPGATVYMNEAKQYVGYAPAWVKYDKLPRGFIKRGDCQKTQPLLVRWVSGAEATLEPTICGSGGKKQQLTFVRPSETPGRELDAQFAAEIIRATQAQSAPPAVVYVPRQRPQNCTSTLIGNRVFTNCY